MNNIFLFPGQGSQTVGMGKDLAAHSDRARRKYAEAGEILGYDLASVSFEGPDEALRQTRVTQPALYVHSCVLVDALGDLGYVAHAAAGHSVGEYAALYGAGVFDFAEGLRLVKARADSMQMAGETNPGTMAAIIGLDDEDVRAVCDEVARLGVVVPANFNSPGQIVISGSVPAVREAMAVAKSKGAKMAKELTVSGAFHSPLMQPAADSLAQALEHATLSDPRIPVISNVTAQVHSSAGSVRRLLVEQLLSPVRWSESLMTLAQTPDSRWLEVGSGTVLSGLLKRTIAGSQAIPIGTSSELNQFVNSRVVTQ